eukprot:COSAG06_NODE_61054_length_269_cov_0.558824_1_plen_47_part_01
MQGKAVRGVGLGLLDRHTLACRIGGKAHCLGTSGAVWDCSPHVGAGP